jgi:hypothetical protein
LPSRNPEKPEQIATKAPRHKVKHLVNIFLRAFVSWWRKCFFIKCKEIAIKNNILSVGAACACIPLVFKQGRREIFDRVAGNYSTQLAKVRTHFRYHLLFPKNQISKIPRFLSPQKVEIYFPL